MDTVATLFASTVDPSSPASGASSDAFGASGNGHSPSLSQFGLKEVLQVHPTPADLHHASTAARKQVCDLLDVAASVKTATLGSGKSAAEKATVNDPLEIPCSKPVEVSATKI
jgi:hypothetical protein